MLAEFLKMNYYEIMPLKISQYVYFLTFVCFVQISFGQQPTSENEQRIKAYFQKFPKSDADKDGVLTLQELLTHMRQMRQGSGSSNNDDQFKPEPENTNIRYSDKHERNVLDYYPAKKQDSPAPVYVWFHGGGFSGGDKGSVRKNGGKMIKEYLDQGYAVFSCNYPFINRKSDVLRNGMLDEYVENNFISKETPEQQKSRSEYLKIMAHCGRAIQFIRSKSKEWNIDPQKICVGGASAGALISQWLAYSDDLAKTNSDDPVEKLSSKAQVSVGHVQPVGTDSLVMKYMDKGEAPLFIYTNAPNRDVIHHPINAVRIIEKAKELKIPYVAVGGGRNELPVPKEGSSWLSMQLEFCAKHLKLSSSN